MNDSLLNIKEHLPELLQLQHIIERGKPFIDVKTLYQVKIEQQLLPMQAIAMGTTSAHAPAIVFVGGVHGVERIGSQVILSLLTTIIEKLHWDSDFRKILDHIRLVFIPMANPGGIWLKTRANPYGVDLMRNAPIDAMGKVPFLVGGHRISKHLPWYRGKRGAAMEPEAQALLDVVRQECFQRPFSLTVDCHSGFGIRDRLWFPYARSHRPFENLAEAFALKQLFDRTHPNHHDYIIEPQSLNYTTHGDLWDYLYDESLTLKTTFLPFTLEMGSWLWVKKNPKQIFNFFEYFNPVLQHRQQRVLRQHTVLFEFLIQATRHWKYWKLSNEQQKKISDQALNHWFIHHDQ